MLMIMILRFSFLFGPSCLLAMRAGAEGEFPGWGLVDKFEIGPGSIVSKYVSTRTNLTLLLAAAESPVVNGFFCLATETLNNDGLPHTLEHLIFLGSEEYPYKELLDLSANRFLADRTNAFTETDHTCYTVYTAGTGGFLNILPMYLDHILYPLLREEDYLTEVHHINGDGEDAGVVYSEMQGSANSPTSLLYFPLLDALYPGNSSYESNAGGALKNLRESTNINSVREYHKKYYVPENLYLTITGSISEEQIFKALSPIEDKILLRRNQSSEKLPFQKPFRGDVSPLLESQVLRLKYSSEEETLGNVIMGWRLPGPINEKIDEIHAWNLITSFLTAFSSSPLVKRFVEIPSPLATTVDFEFFRYRDPSLTLEFSDVPVGQMEYIESVFKEEMNRIVKAGPAAFPIDRIKALIKVKNYTYMASLENGPYLIVSDPATLDQMYGESKEDFRKFVSEGNPQWISYFASKDAAFWINMIQTLLDLPRILVIGSPNSSLSDEMVANETARVKNQIAALGQEGLEEAERKLQLAIDSQKLPPEDLLKSFPLGDVESINFRSLAFYNYTSEKNPYFDIQSIPYRVHINDINTEFIKFNFVIDISGIKDPIERAVVPLFHELWSQLPIRLANGTLLSMSEVSRYRSDTTTKFITYFGNKGSTLHPGSQSENIIFFVETLPENSKATVELLKNVLFRSEFTAERVRSIFAQLLNGIPITKVSASKILSSLSDNLYFNDDSYIHHSSPLRIQRVATKILADLDKNETAILERFNAIRRKILTPENVFLCIASNLEKNLVGRDKDWINLFEDSKPLSEEFLSTRYSTLSENAFRNDKPEIRHVIGSMPSSESCHIIQSFPYYNQDWESDEVAVLRVALRYLTDRMYDRIRGKGYTYSTSCQLSVTEGRISMKMFRSSLLPEAYEEFRHIIKTHTNASEWSEYLLDSARGSQIYAIAEAEETVMSLVQTSFSLILRRAWDPLFNRRFVQRISHVTLDKVRKVVLKLLNGFFNPDNLFTAIVCNPADIDRVASTFQKYNISLERITDFDHSILSE